MLNDGLHLSEKGNSFVAKALISLLDKKLPDLTLVFPDWKDLLHPKQFEKILGKL